MATVTLTPLLDAGSYALPRDRRTHAECFNNSYYPRKYLCPHACFFLFKTLNNLLDMCGYKELTVILCSG